MKMQQKDPDLFWLSEAHILVGLLNEDIFILATFIEHKDRVLNPLLYILVMELNYVNVLYLGSLLSSHLGVILVLVLCYL